MINRQTILNVGLVVALVITILFLIEGYKYKGVVEEKEKRIEQLQKTVDTLKEKEVIYEREILSIRDSVRIKDSLLLQQEVIMTDIKRVSKRQRDKIEKLTESEADSILYARYPDKEKRSKEILTDLEEGKENEQLLFAEARKVGLQNQKIGDLEAIIANQDGLIANLRTQIESYEEMEGERQEQIKLLKKEVKRQKRQKIFVGIGAGAVAILALIK